MPELNGILVHPDCRHFRGDLPCRPNKEHGYQCDSCPVYAPTQAANPDHQAGRHRRRNSDDAACCAGFGRSTQRQNNVAYAHARHFAPQRRR